MLDRITVHGARQHNLKNIDVEIPRNSLTVITGLSGSGKSSLAFDTIYAEGQRRYVETLSTYARQFLDQMERPDVDSIDGLSPEISLDKRKNHTIEVVVDRLLVKAGIEKRLEASIDTATKLANGLVLIVVVNGDERLYSQKLACMECGTSVPQLEPRSFSFNSPYGACEECHGLGNRWSFDPAKVIADPGKPLLDGGLGPGAGSWHMQQAIEELARQC